MRVLPVAGFTTGSQLDKFRLVDELGTVGTGWWGYVKSSGEVAFNCWRILEIFLQKYSYYGTRSNSVSSIFLIQSIKTCPFLPFGTLRTQPWSKQNISSNTPLYCSCSRSQLREQFVFSTYVVYHSYLSDKKSIIIMSIVKIGIPNSIQIVNTLTKTVSFLLSVITSRFKNQKLFFES